MYNVTDNKNARVKLFMLNQCIKETQHNECYTSLWQIRGNITLLNGSKRCTKRRRTLKNLGHLLQASGNKS